MPFVDVIDDVHRCKTRAFFLLMVEQRLGHVKSLIYYCYRFNLHLFIHYFIHLFYYFLTEVANHLKLLVTEKKLLKKAFSKPSQSISISLIFLMLNGHVCNFLSMSSNTPNLIHSQYTLFFLKYSLYPTACHTDTKNVAMVQLVSETELAKMAICDNSLWVIEMGFVS